jgi:class 3 adenylate cyclase
VHIALEKDMKRQRDKTMEHLLKLLPKSIVTILQDSNEKKIIAEKFDSITILFVDMVGFTNFSAQLEPDELLLFLNHLYSEFDVVLNTFSLYKVEIIGDALFAVAGCPTDLADDLHAARAVCAASGILEACRRISDDLEIPIEIRIGVHTGSVVAGVVGRKDYRYHLFGETVSTAEKVESTGAPGKIHCSEATKQSILKCGTHFDMEFNLRKMPDEMNKEELSQVDSLSVEEKETLVDHVSASRKGTSGNTYFVRLVEEDPKKVQAVFKKLVLKGGGGSTADENSIRGKSARASASAAAFERERRESSGLSPKLSKREISPKNSRRDTSPKNSRRDTSPKNSPKNSKRDIRASSPKTSGADNGSSIGLKQKEKEKGRKESSDLEV